MKTTKMLVLALGLFVSTPVLAQTVHVKDLRTGAEVKLAVDAPVRLVLGSDRVAAPVQPPAAEPSRSRGCRYARYQAAHGYSRGYSHGYYVHQSSREASRRQRVGRMASFVAAIIVGFSVISMVRSLERWRASP